MFFGLNIRPWCYIHRIALYSSIRPGPYIRVNTVIHCIAITLADSFTLKNDVLISKVVSQ